LDFNLFLDEIFGELECLPANTLFVFESTKKDENGMDDIKIFENNKPVLHIDLIGVSLCWVFNVWRGEQVLDTD
jgi:hypothetical protein